MLSYYVETALAVCASGGGKMQPGFPNRLERETATPEATHDESLERTLIDRFGVRNYDNFLRNRARFRLEHNHLHVLVNHPFVMELLQSRFREPLLLAARSVYGPAITLQFTLDPDGASRSKAGQYAPSVTSPADAREIDGVAASPVAGRAASRLATAFLRENPHATPNHGTESSRASDPRRATAGGTEAAPASDSRPPSKPGAPGPGAATGSAPSGRRLARLDEFVEGRGSRSALAAARDFVQRDPGDRGSLYVFGPTGTGKTHLLEGIVHSLRRGPTGEQALLLTAEQFTNLFTSALRSHGLPAFRQKLRGVDVLLIDDVDFLDGKPKVQEEFLHTLQQLESAGRRFVLAADRHPRLLSRTRPELQSRYLSGTTCRVELPDQATREQIVARKALSLGLLLPPEAARIIAQRIQTSVRELEGALHNLRNLHRASGQPVSLALARQVVSEIERDCVRVVRLPDIERVVCETFGVSVEELRSARRTRVVSEPRMLAMYLARRHTRAAYAEIGAYFGGRNHATVMSAEKKVQSALDNGAEVVVSIQPWRMADLVQAIEQQLLAS